MSAEEVAKEIEENEKHAGLSSSAALDSTSLHSTPLLSFSPLHCSSFIRVTPILGDVCEKRPDESLRNS